MKCPTAAFAVVYGECCGGGAYWEVLSPQGLCYSRTQHCRSCSFVSNTLS